jgi:EpsI family protein
MSEVPPTLARRSLLIGAALIGTGVAAFAATPRRVEQDFSSEDLSQLFPAGIGPWVGASAGLDVVPDVDNPKQEQIFSRIYSAYGMRPMMLVVSYHGPETSDIKAHPPEICYAASGFAIDDLQPVDIDLGPARVIPGQAFTGRRGARVEQVLYVTRVGRYFPRGLVQERQAVLKEALAGVRADGVVFRVSVINPSLKASLPRLEAFARVFLEGSGRAGREAILGPGTLSAAPILKGPLTVNDKIFP